MKLSERGHELHKMRIRLDNTAAWAASHDNPRYYDYAVNVGAEVARIDMEVASRHLREGGGELTDDEIAAQNMQIAQAAHIDPGDLSLVDWDDLVLRIRWAHVAADQDHGQQVLDAVLREMLRREIRKQMNA